MAVMDDDKKTEETPVASSEGKSSLIKWVMVFLILLLFIGIEVGIAVFFVGKLKEPDAAAISAEMAAKARQDSIEKQTAMGATMAAPIEITVNIFCEEGRYLKCGVQLEYDAADEQLSTELEARKARMKDIIIDIMSSKSLSDLMSNDGKKAIRDQIVSAVNNILPEEVGGKPLGKVRRSYFDSFVMQ
ncbi:MAG: flagellar basal body-associated FliL family protein [Fibromonadaceae bacterium]|jgi:flagellar FliL protein|nr:flagellar basal body-associated FliL family protein [Fibromonadaceae bacterium]